MTWSWAGAFYGALIASGIVLVYVGLPWRRKATLMHRVEPYVRDAPPPSRLFHRDDPDAWNLVTLGGPALQWCGRQLDHILGGSASVRRRLERAGRSTDVQAFRAEQALWGLGGAVAASVLGSMFLVSRGASLVPVVALVFVGMLGGVMLRDQLLSDEVRRREQRILQEFPTIAEMLALSVTAGEGAAAALERVTRLSRGDLASELEVCLAQTRAGATLVEALQQLADRTGVGGLARFVDGIVVAVERGTPLADVLRAQAQDARDSGRQALIEEGGKREISMMIPVVFLVLPVTILFAIYPAFTLFRFAV